MANYFIVFFLLCGLGWMVGHKAEEGKKGAGESNKIESQSKKTGKNKENNEKGGFPCY